MAKSRAGEISSPIVISRSCVIDIPAIFAVCGVKMIKYSASYRALPPPWKEA